MHRLIMNRIVSLIFKTIKLLKILKMILQFPCQTEEHNSVLQWHCYISNT